MRDVIAKNKYEKWYNNGRFPLIPNLDIHNPDDRSTKGFTFHWMFFKAWSLDHVELEVSAVCSTHWGLGVIGILPYLRWCCTIPIPEKWGTWFSKKTRRDKRIWNQYN